MHGVTPAWCPKLPVIAGITGDHSHKYGVSERPLLITRHVRERLNRALNPCLRVSFQPRTPELLYDQLSVNSRINFLSINFNQFLNLFSIFIASLVTGKRTVSQVERFDVILGNQSSSMVNY